MTERIVVDPITRIEGHLRIEAQMEGDRIGQAYSSGTMVRGIETILKGRDPRDAWAYAQRICGVCTLVHGIASVRAVEDALDYQIPKNAELIRNLMIGAQYIHDHVMHFYHLHALDWVDVVSALNADPKATSELAQSLSGWPKSSPGYFADVKKKLKDFVEAGQLGIFAKAYWGHSAYRLPAEANLMATAHYLEALTWQRDVARLHTIFGGKNPHPNFLVGGAASPIDLNSDSAINARKLSQVKDIIDKMRSFVDQVYLPDTLAVASFYKDWFTRGEGLGNFLCYGDLPDTSMRDPESYFFPSGVILNRDINTVHEIDLHDQEQIREFVAHSWYDYDAGKESGLHPYDGETNLNYTGPKPPYRHLDVEQSYSWLKAPRWRDKAMEVGPLARVLLLYAKGHEPTRELATFALQKLGAPLEAMFSTLGRTAARTLETKLLADQMQGWYDDLIANIKAGDTRTFNETLWEPSTWPDKCQGAGFMEAPRGALGHWVVIEDGRIANYQAIVPSTWNAGPRDATGQAGAYEAALQDNHQMADPKQPLEILRTIHSFDPCIACAVHLADEEGEEMVRVQISGGG
ncbi:MAG: hydrogenase 2 large subunit [Candidatus Sedimenticola endophacoides]|uniref:Uptake hydrogenase large subunit n=1 Tax=Candidatus Sedimenticola endophacoides TaxID=2548426 RepID=A0A657Q666_9GAMM|nr:MAG: hydrogenase 2 large subunit [Candidatus Sedimenticola endophacoides]OQX34209.1 MAG: hydrogenase 2 large subunit [Candidatus Sedimenticola endophacoides]OQX42148.1 MAG: hydrogenase 2 large subunit [Candidatus Sedimenticola endophacoides]OQX43580.1 MAG: hydrogenase 2 large subunit [Candidatus Sedimenticola endophacoides]OQX44719.1 MAG: hydrogenase 2 large subunit [Candidatus Sedimenticola endophacoides]